MKIRLGEVSKRILLKARKKAKFFKSPFVLAKTCKLCYNNFKLHFAERCMLFLNRREKPRKIKQDKFTYIIQIGYKSH